MFDGAGFVEGAGPQEEGEEGPLMQYAGGKFPVAPPEAAVGEVNDQPDFNNGAQNSDVGGPSLFDHVQKGGHTGFPIPEEF